MSLDTILLLIKIILCLLAGLYGFVFITKLRQIRNLKLSKAYSQIVEDTLNGLLYNDNPQFENQANLFIADNKGMMKRRIYREVIEDILMNCLRENEKDSAAKALIIAYGLELPPKCLNQIKSNQRANIASGCQKAGLYRYENAIPAMIDALTVFSSDTQMEILRALFIISDFSAIEAAFDKIQNMILINERYIFELILSFTGDKRLLCTNMIAHKSNYVSALFLKAMSRDDVFALRDEIIKITYDKDKEKRIAAMKALGKTNDKLLGDLYINALSDPDWEVRAISAKILGDIIVPQADEPLVAAVRDREWWVRQNAAISLLRYPRFENAFITTLEAKDKYAYQSVLHALNSVEDDRLSDQADTIVKLWQQID